MEPIRIALDESIKDRRRWVEGWNKMMLEIWAERIYKLGVMDTNALYNSLSALKIRADGRFMEITLSQTFLEYGIWQDLGTGWGYRLDNGGDLPFLEDDYRSKHNLDKPRKRGPEWGGGYTSGNPRERRRWESPKYYSSALRLRDFMAESLGDEFKAMFCAALDADNLRLSQPHYKRMGYTR